MKPLKDLLSQRPHDKAWDLIKLPWQTREPINEKLLDPFENLWQFCEWLRIALHRHSKRRNTP